MPDVSDLRVGHGDDLPRVGGIGQDFLVARHAGIEDDFADAEGLGTEGGASVDGSVGQGQQGGGAYARTHGTSTPRSA